MNLSALLFNKLGSSACCHRTAENVDHILEFGDKMNLDSLQEGLISDTETFSISNLPQGGGGTWVTFCWVCAAGFSGPLPHYSLFCGQL